MIKSYSIGTSAQKIVSQPKALLADVLVMNNSGEQHLLISTT